jgi:uncharacterized protein YecE (DUF72 family)
MNIAIKNYYAGTSGLLLPVPNKLHYPENFRDKSRLCYYASMMNSIEINSSFYKVPQLATVSKWAADVPEEFRFTFKLYRDITHNKTLAFDPVLVAKFFEVTAGVEHKKGCLLVQFPPSIHIEHFAQLRFLMSVIRDNDPNDDWKTTFEFRHPSLYVDEVAELLTEFRFGMVIHDKFPNGALAKQNRLAFTYLRFHGPDGDYRGSYSDALLSEYADYILEWLAEGKKVFVYFNNTMGDALGNLNTLRSYLH